MKKKHIYIGVITVFFTIFIYGVTIFNTPKYSPDWQSEVKQEVKILKTKSGTSFLYLHTPTSGVTSIRMLSEYHKDDKVYSFFDKRYNILPTLTENIFLSGTDTQTQEQVETFLSVNGVSVDVSFYRDGASASVNFLTDKAEKIIPYYLNLLQKPTFSEIKLKKMKKRRDMWWATNQFNVETAVFFDFITQIGLGKTYIKHRLPEYYRDITRQDILEYYNVVFATEGLTASIATGLSEKEAIKYMSSLIDWMPAQFIKPKGVDITVKENTYIRNVPFKKPQTYVMWSGNFAKDTDKNRATFKVLENIMAGNNGYLVENLREEKGLVYWLSLDTLDIPNNTFTIIGSTEVANDKVDEYISELKMLLEKAPDIITRQSVMTAKSSIINSYLFSLTSNSAITRQMQAMQSKDLKTDFLKEYINHINDVSISDVKYMLHKYMKIKRINMGGNTKMKAVKKAPNILYELQMKDKSIQDVLDF